MSKLNLVVYIGRFQPFHNGQKSIIDHALKRAEKILVLIGSANSPCTTKNPFSYNERESMIRSCYENDKRIIIQPLTDFKYNDELWVKQVQNVVKSHEKDNKQIGIIGYDKDETSFYLNLFPQWQSIKVKPYFYDDSISEFPNGKSILSATNIRDYLFSSNYFKNPISLCLEELVQPKVQEFLEKFVESKQGKYVKEEYLGMEKYHDSWAAAPYPPTFVTVDAVVIQSGHVLVVKRRSSPGKGLLALPGGFLNQKETIKKGMLRELREETKIKVPESVLDGSIKHVQVFDDPNRSTRGRTITHAFLIHLKPTESLPRVKGSDDAEKAFWVPLSELHESLFFEDHYFIIRTMLGKIDKEKF